MTYLALDLGTQTGYAIYKDGTITSGVKKLRVDKRALGSRFLDFRNWLIEMIKRHSIEKVFFERVCGHSGTEAAHVYGGMMYTLATVCLELNIECISLPVKTIKKFITGKGNASKEEMIIAARKCGFNPKTDDEADALGILSLGLSMEQIHQNSSTVNCGSGSFRALIESGYRAPAFSLASEK